MIKLIKANILILGYGLIVFAGLSISSPNLAHAEPERVGICTGYIVTSTGDVATAAHCEGKRYEIYYNDPVTGKRVSLPADQVAITKEGDTMILHMNTKNLPHFNVNGIPPFIGQNIAYMGYPNPERFGFNLKSIRGSAMGVRGTEIVMSIFSGPGASGSAILDSNGDVIGTLVAGRDLGGFSITTYAKRASILIDLAAIYGVELSLRSLPGDLISADDLARLTEQNKSKVVLIVIHE